MQAQFHFGILQIILKHLNSRGYSADELKIKFHKYLSLPIYLFGIILLSTIFTIGIKTRI